MPKPLPTPDGYTPPVAVVRAYERLQALLRPGADADQATHAAALAAAAWCRSRIMSDWEAEVAVAHDSTGLGYGAIAKITGYSQRRSVALCVERGRLVLAGEMADIEEAAG